MKKPVIMKSGTIMELKEKTAVLLTDDCDFVEIPRLEAMDLGQRLSFAHAEEKKTHHYRKESWIGLLAAACLFIGCIGLYGRFMAENRVPYAYITIDINPSIELAVDRHYRVIGWESFNADGSKVLNSLQIKGKEADEAIKGIVDEALKQGYFKNHEVGTVLLAAVPNEEYDDFQAHKDQVDKDLAEFIVKEEKAIEKAEDSQINVTGKTLAPKVRKAAKTKKISAGREYLIANAAQSGAKDISEEEIKKANITELLVDHGAQVLEKEVFDQYKKDDQILLNETRKKRPRLKKWKFKDGTYQNRDGSPMEPNGTEGILPRVEGQPMVPTIVPSAGVPEGTSEGASEGPKEGEGSIQQGETPKPSKENLSEQERKEKLKKWREQLAEKRKLLREQREKKKLEKQNQENKDEKIKDPKVINETPKDPVKKWKKKKQKVEGTVTPTPTPANEGTESDKSKNLKEDQKGTTEKKKKVKKPQKPKSIPIEESSTKA